jgi:decaprenylphospho-beta-D-ribofuranose 2-oxidase
MGLTGVILRATFRLQRVGSCLVRQRIFNAANLGEVVDLFEEQGSWSYSVAWIDCLARGAKLGRSLLMVGEHADEGTLYRVPAKGFTVPFDFPRFCLNRYSVSAFNHLYHRRKGSSTAEDTVSLDTFFFPLDSIQHWNRIYGSCGFTQYQFVLPKAAGARGVRAVLTRIAESGLGSFLAVLKLFGKGNDNLLSFPMEGLSLALDFKIERKLFPLLEELDRIVADHGGRLYLAKDVRMSGSVFRRGYPRWEAFRDLREKYGLIHRFNSLQAKRLEI